MRSRSAVQPAVSVEERGVRDKDAEVVHLHLPIEVELRAGGEDVDVDAVAERALLKLARALESA